MRTRCRTILCCLLGSAAYAAGSATVRMAAETVPPGSTAQLKFFLTAPQSLSSGTLAVDLDPAFFGDIGAASAFSGAGDAYGYATIAGRRAEVHFYSATGSAGVVNGLPIVTVTVPLLSSVAAGASATVTADPGSTPWKDGQQLDCTITASPGTVTAGGALSIASVAPAIGVVPAGGVVHLYGSGFNASTTADIQGVVVSTVQFVSPQQMDVTFGAPAEITGKRVRLRNADDAPVDFFPAFAADPVTTATTEPLVNARPILPLKSRLTAETSDLARQTGWVLVQNPNAVAADVAIQTGYAGGVSSQQVAAIPPGGSSTVAWGVGGGGGTVRLLSSAPVYSVILWEWWNGSRVNIANGAQAPGDFTVPPLQLPAGADPVSRVWQTGSAAPVPRTIPIYLPEYAAAAAFTVSAATESGGGWLSVTPPDGAVSTSAQQQPLTVSAAPGSLAPGIYRGSITVTPAASTYRSVEPTVIPAAMTIVAAPLRQTVMACCYEFASPSGLPASYQYAISTDIVSGPLSVASLTDGGGSWLSASLSSAASPATLTLSGNPAGVPPGQYSGEVMVTGSGSTVYAPVLLHVYGGVQLAASASILQFFANPGDALLEPQTIAIKPACVEVDCPASGVPTSIPWSATAKTNSGGNWLTVVPGTGQLTVRADPTSLASGIYTGAVTLTSASASGPSQIPVVLLVAQPGPYPALTASPSSLTFPNDSSAYTRMTAVNAGSMDVPLTIAVTTTDGGDWLAAASTGVSAFPGVVSVSVNPAGLAPGRYTGQVTVRALGQSLAIPVTAVIPRLGSAPSIGSIVNAASAAGGAIAPGELVTIRGSLFAYQCRYCASPDTSNPLTVYLNGAAAKVLSATTSQVLVAVPTELAGQDSVTLELRDGNQSATVGIPLAPAAPGIFTLDSSGQGQAAALNADNSINSATNPARRGSVVQLFLTGSGTGPVTVTLGGVPAQTTFAGQAPGAVDGLYQVNVVVPPALASSSVPLLVTTCTTHIQNQVTLAVE
jgi:uncharacterized protein (TIGR03437 family)